MQQSGEDRATGPSPFSVQSFDCKNSQLRFGTKTMIKPERIQTQIRGGGLSPQISN